MEFERGPAHNIWEIPCVQHIVLKKGPLTSIFITDVSNKWALCFVHDILKLYSLKASEIFNFVWEFDSL